MTDILAVLNNCIKREGEAQTFYNKAALKASNEKGQRLFEWLSHEETGHIKVLQSAIKGLMANRLGQSQGTRQEGDSISQPVERSEFPSKTEIMGKLSFDAPELEIIQKAIEAEKADVAFYEKMARDVDDPECKKIMGKLARVEKGHAELLEEEYQWIKHSKDLFTIHRFQPGRSRPMPFPR